MKDIFRIIVGTSLFISEAYGYNDKILELEADVFLSKLCSGSPITLSRVERSLVSFSTGKEKDVGQKYSSPLFQDEVCNRIKDSNFSEFAEVCKDAAKDECRRIAVNLLLERVYEKYTPFLLLKKRAQTRRTEVSQQSCKTSLDSSAAADDFLNVFANADRRIVGVH